jgi:RNA polymerase sigma-70 factor (ECF subfamily)
MEWVPPADSTVRLPGLTRAEPSSRPSPLEEEVAGLFDELRTPVLRYLLSLGLSAPDGDEVVQEVFLALFQHLQRGKSRRNLRGWVFRVAHNLAARQHRSKRRDQSVLATCEDGAGEWQADTQPTPEQQLAGRQRQARLLAVLRALPERDRCCLYLRAEGLRYREIANVLGMSLGAVALSMQRSLARLSRADGC